MQALFAHVEHDGSSGAMAMREHGAVRHEHAVGFADLFTGQWFDMHTPVDSALLAKPVMAATVLALRSASATPR